MIRTEPIFNLETPLLFAHRGGAWEVPESTLKGFRHAKEIAKADVLELDVNLTDDGKFVVWHGPELDNVRIEGQNNKEPSERPKNKRKIYHYNWEELNGKAWVADPKVSDEIDLSNVPKHEDRQLLLLSDFLKEFPDIPLNIEMKKSFKRKINDTNRRGLKDNIKVFTEILDNDPINRTKVVVSTKDDYIDEFRKLNEDKYPTGLSIQEQLYLLFFNIKMKNRALETTYDSTYSGIETIEKVREAGGSTFAFLTGFGPFLPAVDKKIPSDEKIFKILDRGIDGIMTDRPACLREIIDRWKSKQR